MAMGMTAVSFGRIYGTFWCFFSGKTEGGLWFFGGSDWRVTELFPSPSDFLESAAATELSKYCPGSTRKNATKYLPRKKYRPYLSFPQKHRNKHSFSWSFQLFPPDNLGTVLWESVKRKTHIDETVFSKAERAVLEPKGNMSLAAEGNEQEEKRSGFISNSLLPWLEGEEERKDIRCWKYIHTLQKIKDFIAFH